MASVAAMGQLELNLPQTVKNVSTMLTVSTLDVLFSFPLSGKKRKNAQPFLRFDQVVMLAQVALGLFLEYEFITKKTQHIDNWQVHLETTFVRKTC